MEEPLIKDKLLKDVSEEKLETVSGGELIRRDICPNCGGNHYSIIFDHCYDCGYWGPNSPSYY